MKGLELIRPQLADYELIDSGDGAKLERFGDHITVRPEPQAIWRRSLPEGEWAHLADATFNRSGAGNSSGVSGKSGVGSSGRHGVAGGPDVAGSQNSTAGQSDERGQWTLKPGMPDRWTMRYDYDGLGCGGPDSGLNGELNGEPDGGSIDRGGNKNLGYGGNTHESKIATDSRGNTNGGANSGLHLRMRLALTGFKHVGVFPEQAANWNFIYDTLCAMPGGGAGKKVLNLFAYTGGATLAAGSAGADVTHVDSVKQTVTWAADNAQLSGLDGVRWIVDDALKFVRREVRRGNLYDGIILDPPAYGRGPDGEKWVLEQGLDEMLSLCARLLRPHGFFVLNLYSMGLSALLARTAVRRYFNLPDCEMAGTAGKFRTADTSVTSGTVGISGALVSSSDTRTLPDGSVLKSDGRSFGTPGTADRPVTTCTPSGDRMYETVVRQPDGLFREQFGELYFSDRAGKNLPLGVYYRFVR